MYRARRVPPSAHPLPSCHPAKTTPHQVFICAWQVSLRMCRAQRVPPSAHHRLLPPRQNDATPALFTSLSSISTLLMLLIFMWTAYSLIGMQLFSGLLWYCDDPDFPQGAYRWGDNNTDGSYLNEPCESYVDANTGNVVTRPGKWVNSVYHYDNIFDSFVSAFVISLEGWSDQMRATMDIPDRPDYQPTTNNSPGSAVYFIVGTTTFSLYLVNLFIALVFDTYLLVKSTKPNGLLMQADERRWLDYEKRLLSAQPRDVRPPAQVTRKICFYIGRADELRRFILVMITLNLVTIWCESWIIEQTNEGVAVGINASFAVIFAVEAVIKLVGLGIDGYFADGTCFVTCLFLYYL